jgi:hypothetical protein
MYKNKHVTCLSNINFLITSGGKRQLSDWTGRFQVEVMINDKLRKQKNGSRFLICFGIWSVANCKHSLTGFQNRCFK